MIRCDTLESNLLEVPTALGAQVGSVSNVTARFSLTVVEGPNAGSEFVISPTDPGPSYLGQSEGCTFRLQDPEVSRRHLSLSVQGRRLHVKDLRSTNGTFVDGVAIGEAYLRGGELVRLGSSAFRVDGAEVPVAPMAGPVESSFGRVIGVSVEMRRLYPLVAKLANLMIPVVIEGETGTGKEALAESMHESGPRANGPFVVFDCTAVAPNLIESELFGHERGSFTGAGGQHQGYFEQAQGGTLLIDEIGDLETPLQAKLLRAIERSEIRRVGGTKPIRVDVRILAATRRDIDREVQEGRFRDDLYHRLAVARVEMPPLRNRQGDVEHLARHFWLEAGGRIEDLSQRLVSKWSEEPWPGNVRELRNVVTRTVALGELEAEAHRPIESATANDSASVGARIAALLAEPEVFQVARLKALREFERHYVEHALARHGGNVTAAAAASGLARRYFQMLKAGKRR